MRGGCCKKKKQVGLRGRGAKIDAAKRFATAGHSAFKKYKVVSRGLRTALDNNLIPPQHAAKARTAMFLSEQAGYGAKIDKAKRLLSSGHRALKQHKIISRGLKHAIDNGLIPPQHVGKAKVAMGLSSQAGYGWMV